MVYASVGIILSFVFCIYIMNCQLDKIRKLEAENAIIKKSYKCEDHKTNTILRDSDLAMLRALGVVVQ
jgi:hypothetical protein